jgi:hypothetical protein
VSSLFALALLAAAAGSLPPVQVARPMKAATQPVFVDLPKTPGGLTLYNIKGEVVAHCEGDADIFSNCKMEPGVTLDDVMNAWVHAYQDLQK